MKHEIFKILPAYRIMPLDKKYSMLNELKSWCEEEMKLLLANNEKSGIKEQIDQWKSNG